MASCFFCNMLIVSMQIKMKSYCPNPIQVCPKFYGFVTRDAVSDQCARWLFYQ